MARHTRYPGAIIREHTILLIRHRRHSSGRTYWVFPGGGIEEGESEEECVVREMQEETNLKVEVEKLVIDEPGHPGGVYKRRKTYLCRPIAGIPKPGYEPEEEAAAAYSIAEVRWFDLRNENAWEKLLIRDPITYPQLKRLQEALNLV